MTIDFVSLRLCLTDSQALVAAAKQIFGTSPKFLVRTNDPDTSKEAALVVDTSKLEALVYEVIARYPDGCIADDVERELNYLRSHSITPRFKPLIRKGFIYDTGERRKAASGRNQRIVKVVGVSNSELHTLTPG